MFIRLEIANLKNSELIEKAWLSARAKIGKAGKHQRKRPGKF